MHAALQYGNIPHHSGKLQCIDIISDHCQDHQYICEVNTVTHNIFMLSVCVFYALSVAVEGRTDAIEGDTSKCHSTVTWQRS